MTYNSFNVNFKLSDYSIDKDRTATTAFNTDLTDFTQIAFTFFFGTFSQKKKSSDFTYRVQR